MLTGLARQIVEFDLVTREADLKARRAAVMDAQRHADDLRAGLAQCEEDIRDLRKSLGGDGAGYRPSSTPYTPAEMSGFVPVANL